MVSYGSSSHLRVCPSSDSRPYDVDEQESCPRKQKRRSRRITNNRRIDSSPSADEGGSTRRDDAGGSIQHNGRQFCLPPALSKSLQFVSSPDVNPLPQSPPPVNHYARRLAAKKSFPVTAHLDRLFQPGGLRTTKAWKLTMEQVAPETQEAYAAHERDGTRFLPEYEAFKERREFFSSACTPPLLTQLQLRVIPR